VDHWLRADGSRETLVSLTAVVTVMPRARTGPPARTLGVKEYLIDGEREVGLQAAAGIAGG
jgi:hypothetical protein